MEVAHPIPRGSSKVLRLNLSGLTPTQIPWGYGVKDHRGKESSFFLRAQLSYHLLQKSVDTLRLCWGNVPCAPAAPNASFLIILFTLIIIFCLFVCLLYSTLNIGRANTVPGLHVALPQC